MAAHPPERHESVPGTVLPGTAEVQAILRRAREVETREEAMTLVTEAVTKQLFHAMSAGKISMRARKLNRPERAISMLQKAGLDRLLVEAWIRGKLTHTAADRSLNRLRELLENRQCAPEEIKFGILAFDGFAQRLAACDRSQAFQYPVLDNHARDSLLTFARALHR